MRRAWGLYRRIGDTLWIHHLGRTFAVPLKDEAAKKKHREDSTHTGELHSPMPGKLLKLNVSAGQSVAKGQTICVIEAMKMEYALKAPFEGKVSNLYKQEGAPVSLDEKIAIIQKEKES